MNLIIVHSLNFTIFTFLISISINELRCTVIFPTVNTTQFLQNLQISKKINGMKSEFNRKLNTYMPKEFGILAKQKFVNDNNTINLCALRNCQQNDLIKQKYHELLKIQPKNFVTNKLSNTSNQLSTKKMEIGK